MEHNDILYPIFSFEAKWSEDGELNPKYPNWSKDLPEGRVWNGMSSRKMYQKTPLDIEVELQQWWTNVNKTKFVNIQDLTLTHFFHRNESWCLKWFEHWTFDVGQTDEEVLASFQRYVDRTMMINRIEGDVIDGYWKEPYCLMGAEDRWRWHGAGEDGKRETRSDPPCRCKFCKEQGIIKIGH